MLLRNSILSKVINIIILLLIVIVYQSLFSDLLTIQHIKLDLSLLILVFVGLTQGPSYGALFGFLVGLLMDLPIPFSLGAGALVKTSIGYLIGSIKDNLFLENIVSKGGIIFISLCLNDFCYYLLTSGFNFNYSFFVFINYTLLSAVYTSLAGLAILWYDQIRKDRKFLKTSPRIYE